MLESLVTLASKILILIGIVPDLVDTQVRIVFLRIYSILLAENYVTSSSSVFCTVSTGRYETQFSATSPHFVPAPVGYVPFLPAEFTALATTKFSTVTVRYRQKFTA